MIVADGFAGRADVLGAGVLEDVARAFRPGAVVAVDGAQVAAAAEASLVALRFKFPDFQISK